MGSNTYPVGHHVNLTTGKLRPRDRDPSPCWPMCSQLRVPCLAGGSWRHTAPREGPTGTQPGHQERGGPEATQPQTRSPHPALRTAPACTSPVFCILHPDHSHVWGLGDLQGRPLPGSTSAPPPRAPMWSHNPLPRPLTTGTAPAPHPPCLTIPSLPRKPRPLPGRLGNPLPPSGSVSESGGRTINRRGPRQDPCVCPTAVSPSSLPARVCSSLGPHDTPNM